MDIQATITQLKAIKDKYGEEVYVSAARDVALNLIRQGGETERAAREAFSDIPDLPPPGAEVPASEGAGPAASPIIDLIRQTMPSIRTQAQFNVFMAAFDALRVVMEAIFVGDKDQEMRCRKTLDKVFDAAAQVTEVSNKLREVPEAASSPEAAKFKEPPAEFAEGGIFQGLMTELAGIRTSEELAAWYAAAKPRIAHVVSPQFRTVLFDAIRQRKANLSKETTG